jgi:hypothetical protein
MKLVKVLIFFMLVFSLSAFISSAQEDNDPATNPDANACNVGGSMEGKCNSDSNGDGVVSQEEVDWAWNCGWYLIRYEHQMIAASSFPQDCGILLSYIPDAECYFNSIWYSGVPNTDGNNIIFLDGCFCPIGCWAEANAFTYSGLSGGALSSAVVTGATLAEAQANCEAIYDTNQLGVLGQLEAGLWLCIVVN